MTLNAQLTELFEEMQQKAPPPVIAKAVAIFERLEVAHTGQSAPKPGDRAPIVDLTSMENTSVSLKSLLDNGPVVLIFYRGRWCPFCDLMLRAFDKQADEFETAGARLIAVSPQTVAESQLTASERDLSMQVLSDPHNAAAEAFEIAWSLTADEKELYKAFGSMLDAAMATTAGSCRPPPYLSSIGQAWCAGPMSTPITRADPNRAMCLRPCEGYGSRERLAPTRVSG